MTADTPEYIVLNFARLHRALSTEETCNLLADTFALPIPNAVSDAWAIRTVRALSVADRERFVAAIRNMPHGSYDVDKHIRVNDKAIRRWQHANHRAHGESRWVA